MAPKLKLERKQVLLFAGIAFALAVIVVLTLPVISTLNPDYYRRYPGMSARMDHWAASTHSRMDCVDCHMEPGFAGFISYGARSFPAFYSQLFEGAKSTNLLGAPSTAACMKCHTTYRTVAPAGDLKIPHKAHVVVLKMECVQCHKDLVHSENKRGFNRPEMETCVAKCHDGDTASNKCSDCHTSKAVPASHANKDWLQVHGSMAEKVDCAQCHSWTPDFCAECHKKRPASHAGNWKATHGQSATKRGNGCLVCHDQKFCKRCH